jgi:hypothetical protein
MSEEINQIERSICPTPGCGARLPIAPIGGVTLLHASFPQEPLLVGSLLKGSMTHVYCSQCGQRSPYHSSALCFVGPIHTAFVYVPSEVSELHPEVIVELRSKLGEAISTLEGGRIEIITNAAAKFSPKMSPVQLYPKTTVLCRCRNKGKKPWHTSRARG